MRVEPHKRDRARADDDLVASTQCHLCRSVTARGYRPTADLDHTNLASQYRTFMEPLYDSGIGIRGKGTGLADGLAGTHPVAH
jgi:hypothetical protein